MARRRPIVYKAMLLFTYTPIEKIPNTSQKAFHPPSLPKKMETRYRT